MNSATQRDGNIPILTEILATDKGVETAPLPKDELHQSQVPSPQEHDTPSSDFSFDELEKTLHENVLRQLLSRIDFVLEHRVKDGLAEVLQTATDNLTKDIREGLTKSLEEIIHRSINQEISKVQSLKSTK